jgi:uncharacterized protein DUF547
MQGVKYRIRSSRTALLHSLCQSVAVGVVSLISALGPTTAVAQEMVSKADPLHRPFDEMLDLYVRDGFVYYSALRSDRGKLDRYITALNGPVAIEHAKGSVDQQRALWINAYNALVLRTVIDNFPIRGKAAAYPAGSIRQIPGAFEKATHRIAGRSVTLDAIEREILPTLGDARVFLALGRGTVGGGRLRSEAFDAARMDEQLKAVAAESVRRKEIVQFDHGDNVLSVSPVFSWREAAFVASLADKAPDMFRQRSPLERAVVALIEPYLLGSEAEFLDKNTFRMTFQEFDWRLNDLSTRSQD